MSVLNYANTTLAYYVYVTLTKYEDHNLGHYAMWILYVYTVCGYSIGITYTYITINQVNISGRFSMCICV